MFTLVMMTALSGSPDAVQFGGRGGGCTGGGLLSGLFSRGGRGASHAAGCCGPVAHHSSCDPCSHNHHHLPACGGCGLSIPHAPACGGCGTGGDCGAGCGVVGASPVPLSTAPVPVPTGTAPAVVAPPKQMPATGTPPAGATPPVTGGTTAPEKPGGTF